MAFAKTLDIAQAGGVITSQVFWAKGDLPHGVSAIPMKSMLLHFGENIAKQFRLSRVAQRFVQEPTFGSIKSAHNFGVARLTERSSLNHVVHFAEKFPTCGLSSGILLAGKLAACTNLFAEELLSRHVKTLFRPQKRTTQEKESCRISVRLQLSGPRIPCGKRLISPHDESE